MKTYFLTTLFAVLSLVLPLPILAGSAPDGGWATSLNTECTTPENEWIWCDDFETDRSADYADGTEMYHDTANTQGINGTKANAFHFITTDENGGDIKIGFGDNALGGFADCSSCLGGSYNEIYWRMFVKVPQAWAGNSGEKLSRAVVFSNGSDWTVSSYFHVWGPLDDGDGDGSGDAAHLNIDPVNCTTGSTVQCSGYNNWPNMEWIAYGGEGLKISNHEPFMPSEFNEYQCIEVHAKLNTPGQSDGIQEVWINGTLSNSNTGLNMRDSFTGKGINAVFFENYWNSNSPVDQTRYFDNLVVSTAPIGCPAAGGGQPPAFEPNLDAMKAAAVTLDTNVTAAKDAIIAMEVEVASALQGATTVDGLSIALDTDVTTVNTMVLDTQALMVLTDGAADLLVATADSADATVTTIDIDAAAALAAATASQAEIATADTTAGVFMTNIQSTNDNVLSMPKLVTDSTAVWTAVDGLETDVATVVSTMTTIDGTLTGMAADTSLLNTKTDALKVNTLTHAADLAAMDTLTVAMIADGVQLLSKTGQVVTHTTNVSTETTASRADLEALEAEVTALKALIDAFSCDAP